MADEDGFRANIKTNEPGMDVPNPADVIMNANPPSDYENSVYSRKQSSNYENVYSRKPSDDYDATVYGIEALTPSELKPVIKQLSYHLDQKVKTSPKVTELPSEQDSKGFFKYHRFAEQTAPPIYVVDGHLQSPWFPMESSSASQ